MNNKYRYRYKYKIMGLAQTTSKIDAIKYEMIVVDSISDFIDGNYHTISEIYIPKYNIRFNYGDENLHIVEENRTTQGKNIKNIQIEDNLVNELLVLKTMQDNLEQRKKLIIPKIVSELK